MGTGLSLTRDVEAAGSSPPRGDCLWRTIAGDVISPEGPAVDVAGNVFFVSRWTGRVMRVDSAGELTEWLQTDGKPQAVAALPDGGLLLTDAKNQALLKASRDGSLETICDTVDGEPLRGPNDLVLGPHDAVYMTDPGLDMEGRGRVVRINLKTQHAEALADGLLFPNGIALSADGRSLFVAESAGHRVRRFAVVDDGNRLEGGETFYQFDDFFPDGMALDSAGNLLVALHGGGTLSVLSPSGRLIESLTTGGRRPTNCVFGGPDFQTLYLTEDDQQALLARRWPRPGQREFSRSLSARPMTAKNR